MRTSFSILLFLIFFQLTGQAWPNNLIFTLKPTQAIEADNTLGFEVIVEKPGKTFIGKFKKLQQAEVAQQRLSSVGIETELCAFFRTERINLEDAKILSANMNPQEETTMLKKTAYAKTPTDGIVLKPIEKENKNEIPATAKTAKTPDKSPDKTGESMAPTKRNTYFTVQIGVFSKSVKHKFQFEVQERVINGKYYCFYGRYFSIDDAKKELMKIKDKGYQDAFITGIDRGNKVSPNVVKEIINSL